MLSNYKNVSLIPFEATWTSPANIAFVKYWGKKGHQIPANPSLSMTLKECVTKTRTIFLPSDKLEVRLKFKGQNEEIFSKKIYDFLVHLQSELPWLKQLSLNIETENTFPHGAGIASSASGMSAFALTLADYLHHLCPDAQDDFFFKRASYLSRLASGSACRSIYGGFTTWGSSHSPDSSDLFANQIKVHDTFLSLQDTILVVSGKEKNVSSRAGHSLMGEHLYAQSRYKQASFHFEKCLSAVQDGDFETVGSILEAEALALHAMMLTSPAPYTLLKPDTLAAIQAIWDFRQETGLPLYFTLDAGPNLHLIYPESHKSKIFTFIAHELSPLGEMLIHDTVGLGPQKC